MQPPTVKTYHGYPQNRSVGERPPHIKWAGLEKWRQRVSIVMDLSKVAAKEPGTQNRTIFWTNSTIHLLDFRVSIYTYYARKKIFN